jgi:hypothetical protein
LEPLPLTAFTLTNQIPVSGPYAKGGDLAKMLDQTMIESNYCDLIPGVELPQFTTEVPPPELVRIQRQRSSFNSQAKGRLLVFHDSFALSWIPFLGYHFNRIIYLWQYDLNPALVEQEKPDIVINEMNERFFNTENPVKLMAKEALK